jgi:hypothetical protein
MTRILAGRFKRTRMDEPFVVFIIGMRSRSYKVCA